MRKVNRIKQKREELGLGQKELAEKIGVTQQVISLYESDKRKPKLETWQKLADFFGVTIPYLQGIEPDFNVITDQTKETFALIANNYYFGFENNYVLEYEIGELIFDVHNLNKEEWNKIFAKNKLSVYESKNFCSNVNQYLELSKKYSSPLGEHVSKSNRNLIINYWNEAFSFLLRKTRIVRQLNRIYFDATSIHATITPSRLVDRCNSMMGWFNNQIQKTIIEEYSTNLGKYFDKSYGKKLSNFENKFWMSLRLSNSIQDMRDEIIKYNNSLQTLLNELESDQKTGKIEKFAKKEIEHKKYIDSINNLYNEFSSLYKTSGEFRQFALNFESSHHRGIQIIDSKTNKVETYGVSRVNQIPALRAYKKEKGKDTSYIDKFLYSNKNCD